MEFISKKIIIITVILLTVLVLIFNHGLHHHYNKAELVQIFDVKQIAELNKSHVIMKREYLVEEKLKILMEGGSDKLRIILDFDKTLAKYKDRDGSKVLSTQDLFTKIETVPEKFRQDSYRLYKMYGPIESDPTISIHDKLPFMEQWVSEYYQLLIGMPMNKSVIEKAVLTNNIALRDGTKEMLRILQMNSIPVLIFSAGSGDIIKAVLRTQGLNMSNIHVISNFLNYTNGTITGFKGKYIHTFNKDQRILEEIDFKYAKELTGRDNVILVGDSLGDASMADGLPQNATVLRIGFLNDKIEENLPFYTEKFDIVTAGDESMNITIAILDQIL